MPGPTVTVRSTRSTSWMRFMSLTSTRMPPRNGTAPSDSPVPPARGTIGIRSRLASLTTSETSCVVRGRTATSGMWSAQRWTGNGAGTRVRFTRDDMFGSTRSGSPRIARSSSMTASSTALLNATVMAPTSIPADCATSSKRSITSSGCSASAPACDSGRSDHGHALMSVSTSSACAFATRRRLISAVISGFSIGSPPPPPEQYDHCVTWSTSRNSMPGTARSSSRGAACTPLRLFRRQGSWYVTVRSTGSVSAIRPSFTRSLTSSTPSTISNS